ncbi:MAG TPA: DUF898 family protein, partial [Nitratifractor sp.]|nr:DUF898 family protein [Nitratifractor sp.]
FVFKAEPKEYFKIWIVNIALSILTLGIYSAWAKVRTNRYLYASCYINGSNLEYNAKPKRILYGRIIVVTLYALFLLFSDYLAMYAVAGAIIVLFLLLLPWLIRQAISFKLKSTSYRNIPFRFSAKTRSFYWLVTLAIILIASIPLTLAVLAKFMPGFAAFLAFFAYIFLFTILLPAIYRRYKLLVINNAWYGDTPFRFVATKRDVIGVFMKMGLLTFAISIALGIIASVIIGYLSAMGYTKASNTILASNVLLPYLTLFFGTITYLFIIGLFKGISDAFLSNLGRNFTKIKDGSFKGTIHPLRLGFISATNALLILLSLGMLYPWAKIRYLRYKLENTHFACSDYESFSSSGYESRNALGEETLDFFDIEIGF